MWGRKRSAVWVGSGATRMDQPAGPIDAPAGPMDEPEGPGAGGETRWEAPPEVEADVTEPTGRLVADASVAPVIAPPVARGWLVGLAISLVGAWGAAIAYFGPVFGFGPVGGSSWQWSTPHTVLNLIPGVGAVMAGMLLLGGRRRISSGLRGFAALMAFGAGAWFVLGPAVYPVFFGTAAPSFAQSGRGALMNLAITAGYGAGVGIVLCVLAGVTPATSAARLMSAPRTVPAGIRRLRHAPAGVPIQRGAEPAGV